MVFARIGRPTIVSTMQLTETVSEERPRMMKKAQIQFIRQQIEQVDELRRQTGATRTELVRRAVDYSIHQVREHGLLQDLHLVPSSESTEAR